MGVLSSIAKGLTFFVPRRGKGGSAASERVESASRPELSFEPNDPDLDERRAVSSYVAQLMVADEWIEIADAIQEWEAGLATTEGGIRYHEIAMETCLSGLQSLVDEIPHEALKDLAPAEAELSHFMASYHSDPTNHILAVTAARAQLIVGNAARADHWPEKFKREAWRLMARHYMAAAEILSDHEALALMSPLIAETEYYHALGSPGGAHKLGDLFETWISLDPSNSETYAKHAEWMADETLVSDEDILEAADEAMERTEATLGLGGYALLFQPLLQVRENARELYDAELFASAQLDLGTLAATPSEVNKAAGALAAEIAALGPNAPLALNDTLYMLIQNELTVLYPRFWPLEDDEIRDVIEGAQMALPDMEILSKAA